MNGTKKTKYHCECMMENGTTAYVTIKATSKQEASQSVHKGYKGVEFVLDILTPEELERRKQHLRKSVSAGVSVLQA